ncbi:lipocalin family protein [Pseudogulbenkiania ferrooxidans]|uniref:Outer membrane lipoprotein Blc n=1 Tax=Pseudogulbenkiania ferrooxidans 2002 TaxID=279714 RepID=B9YZX1_9NEIS|nr:lipocalin family protein [Pseudogulbenkiania ferrooxidans]EEG09854.1 Lipocalin family protein [Pseudogulbenkiania ferrooxidans 2002]
MRRSRLQRLMLLGGSLLLAACSTLPPPGIQPVSGFELQRYSGKWYEIARLEHRFERGLSDVSASYAPQADGSVSVINRGFDPAAGRWKQAEGRALFNGDPHRASLKVSFFGPFYGGYHVVVLDPDYRWAMVAGNDRSYLWILARDKQLPDDVTARLLEKARQLGFDTGKLIRVGQTRSDG